MNEAIKEEKVEEVVEEAAKKPYTLRELTDEDIFPIVEIIGKVLPDDSKTAFIQVASGEKTLKELGILVAFDLSRLILTNLSSVKPEVYAFLSSMTGLKPEELRKMPFGTTPKIIKEIFQGAKFADFFKELSGSLS